jgi:enamine deaminase RidA (YjgF/YER057c/UK114 family)
MSRSVATLQRRERWRAEYAAFRHVDPVRDVVRCRRVRLRSHRARRGGADLPRRACPLNADGSTAAVGDYLGRAAKAFENLRIVLAVASVSVEDVIRTRVLVASSRQEDLVAAWEVVRESFGAHDVPSALLGVTVLGYRDQLFEIEPVAAVNDIIGASRPE